MEIHRGCILSVNILIACFRFFQFLRQVKPELQRVGNIIFHALLGMARCPAGIHILHIARLKNIPAPCIVNMLQPSIHNIGDCLEPSVRMV
ncbi:Uncharacterised protein [Mycobacteroides abscessus subsp. abscessus]|nr:Uncharacterised protein [Mycobacteroides abscessus subsp. abscessus]